ncbi:FAS1 domain-containing protein [Blakeslea trispora]|nr:FAS1 domain-containing protein [Blakeslea trispora]
MNKWIWVWFYLLFDLALAQVYFKDRTIYESLASISPLLHKSIQLSSLDPLTDLLDKKENITLFLPTESSINASITSGQLNLSRPDITMDYFMSFIVNGSHQAQSFKSNRKTYSTLTGNMLSVGPHLTPDYKVENNSLEVFSGSTKGFIQISDIYCKNGIVQIVSHFLQPAQSPLDTISALPEAQYMEELLKALNVSGVVSESNRTILVPNNKAWDDANGTSIPLGSLVHDLYYLSLEGIHFSDQLATGKPVTLPTSYKGSDVTIQLKKNSLVVNDVALVVEKDIITTAGVIHLIDTVFFADSVIDQKKNSTESSNSSDVFASDQNSGSSRSSTSLNRSEASGITNRSYNLVYTLAILCLFFVM